MKAKNIGIVVITMIILIGVLAWGFTQVKLSTITFLGCLILAVILFRLIITPLVVVLMRKEAAKRSLTEDDKGTSGDQENEDD